MPVNIIEVMLKCCVFLNCSLGQKYDTYFSFISPKEKTTSYEITCMI